MTKTRKKSVKSYAKLSKITQNYPKKIKKKQTGFFNTEKKN